MAERGVNYDAYLEKAIELIKKTHLCSIHANFITDIAKAKVFSNICYQDIDTKKEVRNNI